MYQHGFFDHTGSDGSQSWDRAIRYGYKSMFVAENIGFRYPSVEGVFLGWMDSPPHRENILDPGHQHAGFAWVGGYWTADFGSGGTC
ncbi:MAG TPA: CAP domain-containing protein [Acidimicrobiia bacterium]|nr:CAP domain-containing protein [Acidimicrobiia bacterium]